MTKAAAKQVNKNRRNFTKRAAAGAAIGVSASLLIGTPKKAHAFFWEIPAAIAEFFSLTKEYYETYIEEWVEKVQELKDYYNDDNPIIPSVITVTDSANHVRSAIENMRRKRELEPGPSDHCAGENVGKAKNLMDGAKNAINAQRMAQSGEEFRRLVNDAQTHQYKLRDEINANLDQYSLEEALEALNGVAFVGNRGYESPEQMDTLVKTIMARVRYLIAQRFGPNSTVAAFGASMLARASVAEDSLYEIFSRRVPTQSALDEARAAALPYEDQILSTLSLNNGLSIVDLENFELKRTHESLTWHSLVEESASATAMLKELNLLQAASNDLDLKINDMMGRINQVKSVRALNANETAGESA